MATLSPVSDSATFACILADAAIIIGGKEASVSEFRPELYCEKWGGEAAIKLRHADADRFRAEVVTANTRNGGTRLASSIGGRTHWWESGDDLRFGITYAKPESAPVDGIERWHVEMPEALDWYPQATLTREEEAAGDILPENVPGGFAVYYRKRGAILNARGEGKNYGTGKFCHVYRPKVTDANGKWVWCNLEYDAKTGTLSKIMPLEFLKSATYPIVDDITFGYQSVGAGTGTGFGGYVKAFGPIASGGSGTFTVELWWYTPATGNVTVGLYGMSGNSARTLVCQTASVAASAGSWFHATAGQATLTNANYAIGSNGSADYRARYDSTGNQYMTYEAQTYSGGNLLTSLTAAGSALYRTYSCYAVCVAVAAFKPYWNRQRQSRIGSGVT